jgi:hypothetical protein
MRSAGRLQDVSCEDDVSNGNLMAIRDRDVRERRKFMLYLLALLAAIIIVISALAYGVAEPVTYQMR